ncbi:MULTISPECIES: TetR/AcrR family transcriptional regulator [unclassified Nocardioides]|uniref:TetR/AcrR family transcriptional regulator n=1 Tax=unclassified Nocardioides TaxID=2615069 RepID=UPI0006F46E34|nr:MULTISPECIES: TetR/AcrR family transcriptional regulator [unclassified Nocardioides]KQY56400.1 TetR family transcriptional regulator [Nocardioides sp. Root140]KQZ75185.1 TetR family transcriptional regulator [Nocardioides sp. Root151]KRF14263.1 TetR family transcriptional regulator [Nocardioides sp. Soil796]
MSQPQQERSRATRQRLLDATIDNLAEVGWSGTTVVAVAARAGVSRGAAQHHFATRDDLVRAAVESVTDELTREMREQEAHFAEGGNRPLAVVELLTDMWAGRFGRAATQLWVAAATDPGLRALVLPLEQRFSRELFRTTAELLEVDRREPRAAESVRLTIDLTRGVGLGALLRSDLQRRKADLAQWAAVLATLPGIGS